MKTSALRISVEKVEQGAWVENIPDLGDLRLKVRGIGNADYRQLSARLYNATPRALRNDIKEQDRIMTQLMLDTLLLDWNDLEDEQGCPIPYSREMAEELLNDPELRAFRDGIAHAASIVGEREATDKKDAAKN